MFHNILVAIDGSRQQSWPGQSAPLIDSQHSCPDLLRRRDMHWARRWIPWKARMARAESSGSTRAGRGCC